MKLWATEMKWAYDNYSAQSPGDVISAEAAECESDGQ